MALNLSKLAVKESTSLQLRHPETDELLFDENKQPVQIFIYGTASKQYRAALLSMQNRQIRRGNKKATAEVMKEEGVELLVACSLRADNLVLPDGRVINSPETFRELYSAPEFSWVKDQVDTGLGDVSSFLDK